MHNVVKELLSIDSNPVPDTDNIMDLANSFGEFFNGKVNKIRHEVDNCTTSYNIQMFYVSCDVSAEVLIFLLISLQMFVIVSCCRL